ncbi:MAG: hypothetical protein AAGI01_19165 [Myxococcota bacterium]
MSEAGALQLQALTGAKWWPVATFVLGVSLWAQLFGVGLWTELQFSVPRPHALFFYVVPVGLLAAGIASRIPVLLMLLMPVGLLPGLLMLPGPEQQLLVEGWSMVRMGATLSLYLALASAGADVVRLPDEIQHEELDEVDVLDLRRFVWWRVGVLVVLFFVPAYGVYQDPQIARALSRNYAAAPESAQAFLSLLHFFAWSVAAYMMVLVPALNLEYDQRRLSRSLDEARASWSKRRLVYRVLASFGATVVVLLLLFVLVR